MSPTEVPDSTPPPKPSDPLPDLLARCIEAVDRHGPDAVEPILAEVPQHAAALRRALAQLDLVGLLPERDVASRGSSDDVPKRLGEFRLLRRLGGGGMGVVYLAEQESLGRLVAVKLVRPDQLYFGGARARFRREVEIVARLQDPGIVPIHTVGSEGGIPFFAMEYVAGGSLADVLQALAPRRDDVLTGRDLLAVVAARAEVPVPDPLPERFAGTWAECVARIVEAMANAVQHAHERGVVHRDLKPSNALVTPSGRVLLCDFGLATDGTSPMTQAGQAVGTMAYMAPEQLRSEPVDARTDVYALGVTLHELLARAPAFAPTQGEDLRRAILAGETSSLARRGDVPRDLRVICQKAMSLEPQQRYATAHALAADLGRCLAGRPIAARPAGVALRLWRWRQRQPAAAVALALAIVGGAAAWAFWPDVSGLHAAARRNLAQAIAVLERQIERSSSSELTATPGLDRIRAADLAAAVETLQRLRDENGTDALVRNRFVEGMLLASQLQIELNEPEAAAAMLDKAQAELASWRAGGDAVPAEHVGRAHSLRGALLRWRGELDPAEVELDRAVAVLEREYERAPKSTRIAVAFAGALSNRGGLRALRGRLDDGEADLRRSLTIELGGAGRREMLRSRQSLSVVTLQRGDPATARTQCQEVITQLEALAAADPRDPELRREIARCKVGIAHAATAERDHTAAAAALVEAITLLEPLVAAFPARAIYAWERNQIAQQCGAAQARAGDRAAAVATLRRAVAGQEALCASDPSRLDFQHDLVGMLVELAASLGRGEHEDEASALFVRAVSLAEPLVAARPREARWQGQLANLRTNVALHRLHVDDLDGAKALTASACEAFAALLARGEKAAALEYEYPFTMEVAARLAMIENDPGRAVQVLATLQGHMPIPREQLERLGREFEIEGREDFQRLLRDAR